MIRDGVNPLEKTFDELESYFSQNPQSYEEEAEDYCRFLYQLERKKDVTEEERKAYIGIYRMVHQVEREDGAAVGAVVNTGVRVAIFQSAGGSPEVEGLLIWTGKYRRIPG